MTKRSAIDFAEARPFEIFRTGTHVPMAGSEITFAEADLAASAAAYDPALHQAPIVVGHPKLDAPAYGWVAGLATAEDRLLATPVQVNADFAELVRAGSFKKVSASFYRPDQPGNPVPGCFYLRHVGFLGAQPPAVKGLRPVEFADDDGCLTIEFADWPAWRVGGGFRTLSRLMRGLRDFFIASEGQETADRVLPDWDVQSLADLEAVLDPPLSPSAFSEDHQETDMPDAAALEAREAALRERETELERRSAAFAEAEAARLRSEDAAVLDGLCGEGRLPKTARPIAEALFAEVRSVTTTVDFAEGDTTIQATPRDLLGRLLRAMPLPVETRELAQGDTIDFADAAAVAAAIETEIAAAAGRGETIEAATAVARIKGR